MDAAALLNRANQLNPYHLAYWASRGMAMPSPSAIPALYSAMRTTLSGAALINYANQLNPSHIAYWASRGLAMPSITGGGAVTTTFATISTGLGWVGAGVGVYQLGRYAYDWYRGPENGPQAQ